ncbi:MAG: TetR/AcrR family transcriptional regulator, partial [Gemmataceae bacterium]|nr:TetR/AcrR family transcriptional regulator [Gemmataceae bacterium]
MSAPQKRRPDPPKPSGRLRKAERKQQLLTHAKRLFVKHGYQDTTTKQIAEAAGVTEPVLYRHFETKKALFLEVLEEIRAATLERWHSETGEVTDPLAKLHAIADMYLGSTREHALEFQVMHRTLIESDDEEIAAFLRSFYLDSEALLAGIIAEGQQAGVFRRNLDPRVGAWELIRTALGYTLTLPLGIPLYQEPDYLPRAIECLLHCLLKTDV